MKKTTKVLISLVTFISLLASSLALCLGFSLYTASPAEVKIKNIEITNIFEGSFDCVYIDGEFEYTTSHSLEVYVYINVYRVSDGERLGSTYRLIKTNKPDSGKGDFYSLYIGNNYATLPTAEGLNITTSLGTIKKIKTPLNYAGFALIPVCVCLAGFSAYAVVDFIKIKKEEK